LPPEQSALGIEILLAELIPLVLVLAELRIRTRERQGGADPNGRLGVGVERSDEYEGGCHDDDDHEEDLLLERGSGTARLWGVRRRAQDAGRPSTLVRNPGPDR